MRVPKSTDQNAHDEKTLTQRLVQEVGQKSGISERISGKSKKLAKICEHCERYERAYHYDTICSM